MFTCYFIKEKKIAFWYEYSWHSLNQFKPKWVTFLLLHVSIIMDNNYRLEFKLLKWIAQSSETTKCSVNRSLLMNDVDRSLCGIRFENDWTWHTHVCLCLLFWFLVVFWQYCGVMNIAQWKIMMRNSFAVTSSFVIENALKLELGAATCI